MAARGSVSKEIITDKILKSFEGSFKYDKEIRIPIEENGEIIQIKVTLTAAKQNVNMGGDVALPGSATKVSNTPPSAFIDDSGSEIVEPTQEEKNNVAKLIQQIF